MKNYGLVYPRGNGDVAEVVVFADNRMPTLADFPGWVRLANAMPFEYVLNNTPKLVRVYPVVAEYVATEYYYS